MSALYRMAFGEHNQITLGSGDLVVLSSSAIPGNEKFITKIINELFKRGAEVITYNNYDVHVSGHACREELKLMHTLTNPEFFIPVHGEYKHLIAHVDIARSLGMEDNRIIIPEVGGVVELGKRSMKHGGTVEAGGIMIDGNGVGNIGGVVLRDRKKLSEDGVIIVSACVDASGGEIVTQPEIVTRGFVYERESEDMLSDLSEAVCNSLGRSFARGVDDLSVLKSRLRDDISEFARKRTKRRPMVITMLFDITV